MSAASVSRTGLPFSQLSATASISRLSSIASATLFRTRERSVVEASPQASFAACAASSASSTSSGRRARHLRERLARRGRHVLGVLALHRRDPVAADEVLVARLQLDGTVDLSRSREGRDLLDGCHDSPSVRLYQPQMRLPLDDRSRREPSHQVQRGSGLWEIHKRRRTEIQSPTGCAPMSLVLRRRGLPYGAAGSALASRGGEGAATGGQASRRRSQSAT